MNLTDEEMRTAEEMLKDLADLQTEFWKAALELELFVGFEIDTNNDLEIHTIASLQELAEHDDANCVDQ